MRQVRNRLGNPFEHFEPNFIEKQSENDRGGETEHNMVEADDDRVFQYSRKLLRNKEQLLEMLEANPAATPNAVDDPVVFESKLNTVERSVMKYCVPNDPRRKHEQ